MGNPTFSHEKSQPGRHLGPRDAIGWADVGGVQVTSVIRQRLEREVGTVLPSDALHRDATHDYQAIATEIAAAHAAHLDVGQLNPRPPGFQNAAVQFLKKVYRRSLSWYTRPLHLFQISAIHALQHILRVLQAQDNSLRSLTTRVGAHTALLQQNENDLRQLTAALYDLREEILRDQAARFAESNETVKAEVRSQLDSMRRELASSIAAAAAGSRSRDREVRRIRHFLEAARPQPSDAQTPPATPAMFPSGLDVESSFDYAGFEDLFRGEEALIRTRQQEYLKYFQGRQGIVDIGCGRGEFLELLRDHGIEARGVELNTDQFLLCQEKGLNVVQQDLFSFLESQPDASLGGIFSAQVIEHLTASDQLRYVQLAYQKVAPGSPVIFETINAQCVIAIVRNFFLDPTHIRPVHPETLKFAMESMHFREVTLLYSSPSTQQHVPPLTLEVKQGNLAAFNEGIAGLNNFLYGPQDFAAIGFR